MCRVNRWKITVKLVQLNPFYNIRFEDGSVFHYNNDADYLIEQIRAFNPNDVAGYERFYKASQAVFNKGLPLMTKPFGSITDMLLVAPDMVELQSFKSVAGFVNQYIQDERLRPHNQSEDISNLYFVGSC